VIAAQLIAAQLIAATTDSGSDFFVWKTLDANCIDQKANSGIAFD